MLSSRMAEEVVSPYLRSKFSSILQEAEADPNSPLHIISRFRSIERHINFICETTIIPLYLLYDLIDALSECRILAHQRQKPAASKKGFFRVIRANPFPEFFFKKNMNKRLDQMEKKLTNPDSGDSAARSNGQYHPSPPKLVIQQTYPVLDASRIIGFESQAKTIEDSLIDNLAIGKAKEGEEKAEGLTAIGVVGRCGCGKTALVQKVFASPRIQEEFSPRIWVCLSNMLFDNKGTDTRVRVLRYILEEIGHDVSELEYDDYSVTQLLEKLQSGLMGKRYLIVLDDAWRLDEWYADLGHRLPRGYTIGEFFSHGLPKGSGGGIIVTSRRENVTRRIVGDKHVIRLEPHLSNDICWKIFADVVRQQGEIKLNHPTLEIMGGDIIRNCDGLPLAARTLANIIIPELML